MEFLSSLLFWSRVFRSEVVVSVHGHRLGKLVCQFPKPCGLWPTEVSAISGGLGRERELLELAARSCGLRELLWVQSSAIDARFGIETAFRKFPWSGGKLGLFGVLGVGCVGYQHLSFPFLKVLFGVSLDSAFCLAGVRRG